MSYYFQRAPVRNLKLFGGQQGQGTNKEKQPLRMEEEDKQRTFVNQMLKKRRNAQKILRRTDVYYRVVVGRLDLDLNPLHLMTDNAVFTHAH